jgi:hypothetical protein
VCGRYRRAPDLDAMAVGDWRKGERGALLHRQEQRGTGSGGEVPGARQMVRVDVGVEHVSNRPSTPASQIDVDVRR